jgi:monoamine oxidase
MLGTIKLKNCRSIPLPFDPAFFPDDPFNYTELSVSGLPIARKNPVKIAIIGAGVSGLVAGMELLKAGYIPVIFEASKRIGGRLYTVREFNDPLVYAEMGSMRVPPVHRTLMHYLNLFKIPTRQFPNPNNIKTCYYVNGIKEFGSPKNQIPWIKHLYDKWDSALRGIMESMDDVWNDSEARSTIWQQLNEKYRNTSFRDFLIEQKWSQDEIELFSVVGFGVGGYGPLYPISFIEILRINVCRWDKNQLEIIGGNDRLTNGFSEYKVPVEGEKNRSIKDLGLVHTDTAITHIDRNDTTGQLILKTCRGDFFVSDAVIITAQARAVQMEMNIRRELLNHKQWQAIYNTHFVSSGKIFLETETAFWKEPTSEITTTISDLPIRGTYFFDFEGTVSGLICSSYTWEDDSRKWHASNVRERADRSIDMLEEIYGKGSIRPHVVKAYAFSWEEMPGYRGAFKLFYSGQQHYYEALAQPSNNIWFAGDAVSYASGWIEGALQAGLRAANEIALKFNQL